MSSRPSPTSAVAPSLRLPEGLSRSAQPAEVLEALLREGTLDQLAAANAALGSPVRPEVMAALAGRTKSMARELEAIDTQVLGPLRRELEKQRGTLRKTIEDTLRERAAEFERAFRDYLEAHRPAMNSLRDLMTTLRDFCSQQNITLFEADPEKSAISVPELSRVIYLATLGIYEVAVRLSAEDELEVYQREAGHGTHWMKV